MVDYFRCNFTNWKGFPSGCSIPLKEPCVYAPEKGVWNWVSCRLPTSTNPVLKYAAGTIHLIPDPVIPSQACVQFLLDGKRDNGSTTRPLSYDQHSKLYELQGRQAGNYAGNWVTNREGWFNFKIWLPSNFVVSSWRLLWQSYGSEPVGASGSPMMQITAGSSNINFVLNRFVTAGAGTDVTTYNPSCVSRNFLISKVSAFPKNRWVPVSINVKQGSKFRVPNGSLQIWSNNVKVVDRADVETCLLPQVTWDYTHGYTDPGTNKNLVLWSSLTQAQKDANNAQKRAWSTQKFPYHAWGIGNYGGPSEAYGQYLLFKEVSVASVKMN